MLSAASLTGRWPGPFRLRPSVRLRLVPFGSLRFVAVRFLSVVGDARKRSYLIVFAAVVFDVSLRAEHGHGTNNSFV